MLMLGSPTVFATMTGAGSDLRVQPMGHRRSARLDAASAPQALCPSRLSFGRHALGFVGGGYAGQQQALFRLAGDDGSSARLQLDQRRFLRVEPQPAVISRWTVAGKAAPGKDWLYGFRKADCREIRSRKARRQGNCAYREDERRRTTLSKPTA